MDHPANNPAATAAAIAASVVAENNATANNNHNGGAMDVATLSDPPASSLTLPPTEPPDVLFDRLCKDHQNSGFQTECQICQRFFPNWYKLKQHLHTHADFKPYNCSYCEKSFRNYSKKSRHEKTHSGDKPFVCKLCDKHVTRTEHLKRHLLTHTDAHPFKCVHCEYRSRRLDCIRYHMKKQHPEKENPKIMLNGEIVDVNGDHPNDASDILWKHYKDSPDGLAIVSNILRPPQQNSTAPKKKKKKKKKDPLESSASFPYADNRMPQYPASTSSILGQQLQFNSSLPPSMNPGFSGYTSLNEIKHEQRSSTSTPPNSQAGGMAQASHMQTTASNGLQLQQQLQQQQQQQQRQQQQQKMLDPNYNGGAGDNTVDQRNRFFLTQVTQPTMTSTINTTAINSSSNNLELPRNMCGICEKGFDCPSKLQRHQNTHAGIRPYKCTVCGKALSRPEHLKRHLTTHDPDKANRPAPYKKSKKGKSTVSTSAQALLTQATVVQSQQSQQHNPDATVVISRVKQELESNDQVLTCRVLSQPNPGGALTVVATSQQHPQQLQHLPLQHPYIMAPGQQHQQQPQLLQVGGAMIPWSQVTAGGQAITINTANGIPTSQHQLVAANYSHPVAVLHSYATFGGGAATSMASSSEGMNGNDGRASAGIATTVPVMYHRGGTSLPANMIVNATPSSSSSSSSALVCGPTVFPPIPEMR